MTWFRKMSLIENPRNPDYPQITRMADVRYIDPAHAQSVDFANAVAGVRQEKFDENIFRDGHRNYLKTSIMMLVPMGKVKRAQELYDWIKREYRMTGGEWDFKDVRDWVVWALNSQGSPIPAVASSQITAALQTAFESLAMGDPTSMGEYRDMMAYAKMVYDKYQEKAVARNRFGPYNEFGAMVLTEILVEPRNWGMDVLNPIPTRSELYKALQLEWPALLPMVYDPVTLPLRFQCQAKGIDFTKAFPQPDGLEEYRARRAEQFRVAPPITN
jgi:hypothetical protein